MLQVFVSFLYRAQRKSKSRLKVAVKYYYEYSDDKFPGRVPNESENRSNGVPRGNHESYQGTHEVHVFTHLLNNIVSYFFCEYPESFKFIHKSGRRAAHHTQRAASPLITIDLY